MWGLAHPEDGGGRRRFNFMGSVGGSDEKTTPPPIPEGQGLYISVTLKSFNEYIIIVGNN